MPVEITVSKPSGNKLGYIILDVTRRCNLRCIHCSVDAGGALPNELSFKEIRNVLLEAKELGIERIRITGGEPFIREDFLDILEFISKELGVSCVIETNGMFLDETTVKQLEVLEGYLRKKNTCGGIGLSISLDGIKAKTHDKIRGINGAFYATINGIKNALKRRLRISINTIVLQNNINEILELSSILRSLGIFHHILPSIIPSGRGANVFDSQLSIYELKQFFEVAFNVMRIYKGLHIDVPPALMPIDLLVGREPCGWGTYMMGILPDGNVGLCNVNPFESELIFGNIRERKLREIWLGEKITNIRQRKKVEEFAGVCGNCLALQYCWGYCRYYAYLEYGDLFAPHPICQKFYNQGLFPAYALNDPLKECKYPYFSRWELEVCC